MDKLSGIFCALPDGTKVYVPDSIRTITTYVLKEQGDWFEDEIRFVRKLLCSGQQAIDIGANYGVFGLSMAACVGSSGRVWMFEPAPQTAAYLRRSIDANRFGHVSLEACAVSKSEGSANLAIHGNSELNGLVRSGVHDGLSVVVPVVTLDACMHKFGWESVDFIKMDAEGEELNIIAGGRKFFAACSPLVQYEIKASGDWAMELQQVFASIGYDSYRLVPGFEVLVPFDPAEEKDGFLLNLYCCKPDRAELLRQAGLLVPSPELVGAERRDGAGCPESFPADADERSAEAFLCKFPYAKRLRHIWDSPQVQAESDVVRQGVVSFSRAMDTTAPIDKRLAALRESYAHFFAACSVRKTYARLASLARVSRMIGKRAISCRALGEILDLIFIHRQIDLSEPFLAVGERYELQPIASDIDDWAALAALEEYERVRSYSSFYTGVESLRNLERMRIIGGASQDMMQRLNLVRQLYVVGSTSDTPNAERGPPVVAGGASEVNAKIGRNSPCPCGSGKKFKHCHGR